MIDKWLARMDYKYGRHAFPGVMLYVTVTMLIVYMCDLFLPHLQLVYRLAFARPLILRGEVWRIVTFIFVPPSSRSIWILLTLYFYYWIGSLLENHWGTFRFNMFYLFGFVGAVIAGFITGFTTNYYLNLTLFLALAALYPNLEVLLFMFLPVKIKYLAYIDLAMLALSFIFGSWADRAAVVFSILNFLLFFGPGFFKDITFKLKHQRARKNFKDNYWQ